MTESRDEDGNFAKGHTDGPEIATLVDQPSVAFQRHRKHIKEQYPAAWEKYGIESEATR